MAEVFLKSKIDSVKLQNKLRHYFDISPSFVEPLAYIVMSRQIAHRYSKAHECVSHLFSNN